MADKPKGGKKDKRTFLEKIEEIDRRNATGAGWKPSDFGIYVINPVMGKGATAVTFEAGRTGSATVTQNAPGSINNPATATQASLPKSVLPANTPASQFLKPDEQRQVQEYMQDPKAVAAGSNPIEATKRFLGNVFDTSDTYDPTKQMAGNPTGYVGGDSPVETAWDSLLAGLGWGYNRLSQLTVAGLSGLPGGTRTLTWDEANDVSVGQMVVGGIGESLGRVRRGEGSAGDLFALFATPINQIGTLVGAFNPDSPLQQAGFDITSAQDRKAFEEGPEKFFSGLTDFGFVFADPLILGGKGAKLARLKWVDRPLDTPEGWAALREELAAGRAAIQSVDTGTGSVSRIPPTAMFVDFATRRGDDGAKVASYQDIYNHPAVKYAANRDVVARALYEADDFDTGALIFRYAKGDLEAGAEMFTKRADLVDAMAAAERDRIATIHAMNPDARIRTEKIYAKAIDKAQVRMLDLEKQGLQNTQSYALAKRYFTILNDGWEDVVAGRFDPVQLPTPEGVASARMVFNARLKADTAFRTALGDERSRMSGIANSMGQRGGTKGFAADNRFGRRVEARRQARAVAATQAMSSRGAMRETGKVITRKDGSTAMEMVSVKPFGKGYWKKDVYGNNGFTRTTRLWRWFGEENPLGYVTTRGIGAQESVREIRANVYDVPIYAGRAREITLKDGSKVTVGGTDRGEQLIQMYVDALGDGTAGADATALAVRRLEEAISNDILAWHGIPKEMADTVKEKAFRVRDDVVASITDPERRFFVDADGNFDTNPWLEQHLQNGTYLINFRALEKAARTFDETGLIRFADETGRYVGDNFMRVYRTFNDVWRPSVLLRLGYTMRNVVEGQFRAAAFTSSVDPLRYGVENGYYGLRSTAVSFAGRKTLKRAEAVARLRQAGNAQVAYPRKYRKWLEAQIVARDKETFRIDGLIRNTGEQMAAVSPTYRDWMIDYYRGVQDNLIDREVAIKAAARKAGLQPSDIADELAALRADRDDAFAALQRMTKIKEFSGQIDEPLEVAFEQLKAHRKLLDLSMAERTRLDDDMQAVAMFAQQGRSRQRVFSKPIVAADGRVMQNAFMSDDPFSPVALSLLSADTTQQSMLSLSMDMTQNLFKSIRQREYVNVAPGSEKYFEGFSTTLNNIRNSAVGSRILAGQGDDEIVKFLVNDPDGREIMDFLTQTAKWDADDAAQVVNTVRDRFEQIAPSSVIREHVRKGGDLSPEELRALARPNLDGTFQEPLANIVGNVAEEVGSKTILETWRAATSWTMKWLGTIPEDVFIRQPFYGTRYNQVLKALYANAKAQFGDTITWRELNDLEAMAHRSALKDTKDWMYTIERRTNLGTYGEVVVPFISAAQNSTTTVGRLIWNDPATAVVLADLWRAPSAAGFEDENGNIVIPIPKDAIPDFIENALGFDAMENWKVAKSSLNVIVPESGFGFVPRPGPIVGVAASEMLKQGFLGLSVESPEPLRALLGKEGADQFWNVWKAYTFGEGQGVAPDALSLSLVTPPVAAKLIQMIQGEDNATFGYYYNLIQRSEWMDYLGGKRDDMPQPDEIANKTRGLYMARLLANIAAFTPPQYESKLDPLIASVRQIQQQNPQDSSRIIYQTYGPILAMLGDFSNSKNMAGMLPTADAVEIARDHADLINQVSPGLERLGDLSVISMLTMGGTASTLYDDSAYGWQFANSIPGVAVNFRERQSPEQSWAQSRTNAGWTRYIAEMDRINALMEERGVESLRKAPDLKEQRDQMLAEMATNPLYWEWWQDFKEFGSSRTLSAITMMNAALANEKFMGAYGATPIWQAAREYLYHRDFVMGKLREPGRSGSIDAEANQDIRDYWDQARAYLNGNKEWAAFANRFLNGDENPEEPGVQLASYYEVSSIGADDGG